MRVIRETKNTIVEVLDDRGAGNANHKYLVRGFGDNNRLGEISFQNGPVKESGINGLQNEDLLAIVADRLEGFQTGDFPSSENALALDRVLGAMSALESRTRQREIRGVEGTSTK